MTDSEWPPMGPATATADTRVTAFVPKKKKKIEIRPIPSDDFVQPAYGEEYYPHQGEYVTVGGITTIADLKTYEEMQFGAEEGADKAFRKMWEIVQKRVIEWSWTDNENRPYALPRDEPEIVERLSPEEVAYLFQIVIYGESRSSKNTGAGSSTTS